MVDDSEQTVDSPDEVTADGVRLQLERILASDVFARAPKLRAFLRFVTDRVLDGEPKAISQYSIGIDVYGRDADFDPKADPLIRIEAGRLRRALSRYYAEEGSDDAVLIEIPRGTYAPRFAARRPGAPIVKGSAPMSAAAAVLEPPKIAVFPFRTETPGDDGYLASGLGMELTSELCRHLGIEVVDYTTTSQFSAPDLDIRKTAQSLAIDFVLYGRLRRSGEQLGVDVRLLDVATANQVWAERFTVAFEPASLFALEENIARRVVGRVADIYGVIGREMTSKADGRRVESRTTYEAILRCFHHQLSLSPLDHERVTKDLERAADREPRSALVWALLAQCTLDKTVFGYSDAPDALAQGVRFARHALSLDSSCQYAHYANCYASLIERDAATVEYSAERIVELNPNVPYMVGSAGFFLCLAGRYDRGIKLFEKSVDLNPLFPSWFHAGPFFYNLKKRDLDRALLHARQFALPDFFWGEILRASILGIMGRAAEADAAARKLKQLKPDFPQKSREYVEFFLLDGELADRMLESLGSLKPLTH